MTHVEEVMGEIAAGKAGATLIEWCAGPSLFGDGSKNPSASITESRAGFIRLGWLWFADASQLEKDGWFIWYRSQGALSPPIIQWNKSPIQTDGGVS